MSPWFPRAHSFKMLNDKQDAFIFQPLKVLYTTCQYSLIHTHTHTHTLMTQPSGAIRGSMYCSWTFLTCELEEPGIGPPTCWLVSLSHSLFYPPNIQSARPILTAYMSLSQIYQYQCTCFLIMSVVSNVADWKVSIRAALCSSADSDGLSVFTVDFTLRCDRADETQHWNNFPQLLLCVWRPAHQTHQPH